MASYDWRGVDGIWATATNWDPPVGGPPGANDVASCGTAGPFGIKGAVVAGKLTKLETLAGWPGNIGSSGTPLTVDAVDVLLEGHGSAYLKSTAAVTNRITINSPNHNLAAELDGAQIDAVIALSGGVKLKPTLGSTNIVQELFVGSMVKLPLPHAGSRGLAAPRVYIPQFQSNPTLKIVETAFICRGSVQSEGCVGVLNMVGGKWYQQIEELKVLRQWGGTVCYGSGSTLGPLGTAWLFGGTLDMTFGGVKNTLSICYLFPGGTLIYDPQKTTVSNLIDFGGTIVTKQAAQKTYQMGW